MPSTTIVISEVYGGGGGTGGGASYRNDFVELHNLTGSPISIDGYSVQYASGGGASWSVTPVNGTIQPYGYYLVALGSTGTSGAALPTADATGTTNLSAASGKVALVSSTTALSGANPRTDVVDFVGYGSTSGAEGSAAPAGSITTSLTRVDNANQDTDNNGADFVAAAPNPQNSASPATPCYVTGTRILTARGAVPVEDLVVGDRAITAGGDARPIRWIGHATVACRGRADLLPVRIAAQAFGENRPARDLLVSPAHAICVDLMGEVLIPAGRLLNGTTITQVPFKRVTYWHVELDHHDILIAENLPAESYLDCGNRRFFADAGIIDLAALPDARPEGPLPFCRPFHETGALVDLVRACLEERAEALGWRRVEETFAGLHVVADGQIIRPDVADLTARFVLSAQARDVRLVSATSVPAHVLPGSSDDRRLGVALADLVIDDGMTAARGIALNDARLGPGFYPAERDETGAVWRWTDGAALLPAILWEGCQGTFFLRLRLTRPALPRWIGPRVPADMVAPAALRPSA